MWKRHIQSLKSESIIVSLSVTRRVSECVAGGGTCTEGWVGLGRGKVSGLLLNKNNAFLTIKGLFVCLWCFGFVVGHLILKGVPLVPLNF